MLYAWLQLILPDLRILDDLSSIIYLIGLIDSSLSSRCCYVVSFVFPFLVSPFFCLCFFAFLWFFLFVLSLFVVIVLFCLRFLSVSS